MSLSEHFILPKNETIIIERDNSVLWIWLNRPKSKNALSATMIDEIAALLDLVKDDRSIRTIVIRGKGGVFCAGGDIKEFKSDTQRADEVSIAKGNRSFGYLIVYVDMCFYIFLFFLINFLRIYIEKQILLFYARRISIHKSYS